MTYSKIELGHKRRDRVSFSIPGSRSWGSTLLAPVHRVSDYLNAAINSFDLIFNFDALNNPNAFHDLLSNEYDAIPDDGLKVVYLPVLAPSSSSVFQKVICIGNPVILEALRQIPRAETVSASYYDDKPNIPRISGGRAFDSVLDALNMGILHAEHGAHTLFTAQMISSLTYQSFNDEKKYLNNPSKNWFAGIVREETASLLNTIRDSAMKNEPFSPDFRVFPLKIFLKGFYPDASFSDKWIGDLSKIIEELSDLAFHHMMNPYLNTDELRTISKEKLDPFIDDLMKEDQSFYLSKDYVDQLIKDKNEEVLKQIITSLLYALADNIKKYLDHVFVAFGGDHVRNKYLSKEVSPELLKKLIIEVGRLHTTIYAQPGKALEDFIIEYNGTEIYVEAGDELHYTTWVANTDKMEWGPFANEINPEENEPHYADNNPTGTFGSGARVCRGKSVTLAIIEHVLTEVLKEFDWTATVDDTANVHPTKFEFNNGAKGDIKLFFKLKRESSLEKEKNSVLEDVSTRTKMPADVGVDNQGYVGGLGIFKPKSMIATSSEAIEDDCTSSMEPPKQ